MKKAKHITAWAAGAATYFCIALAVMAYDNAKMHPAINASIVDVFMKNCINTLTRPAELKNYTFVWDGSAEYTGPAITNSGYFASGTSESNVSKTPKKWVEHGGYSADIPEVPAALRHFFDPLGIDGGKTYLTDRGTNWEWIINNNAFNPHINARDWALTHVDNQWTYAKGKEWMRKALAEEDGSKRKEYMAKAWRCLGETLHLVADMGCPVHVRNDSHADIAGWQYRRALGDPDPYEVMVDPAAAARYANGKPDPNLKLTCRSAKLAYEIFNALATFTNENLFTNQTISGMGVKKIDPIIDDRPAYPSPKLEQLEYDPLDFTFYKTFPGGQRVKMCRDQSFWYYRGYPYIDASCIESQASVLIPNIMEAGANVVRLFVPHIVVSLSEAKIDGTVKGSVVHKSTQEYTSITACRGEIYILRNNKVIGTGMLKSDGSFDFLVPNLAKDEEVVAQYRLGGMFIKSDPFKVGDAGVLDILHSCKVVLIDFNATNRYSDGKDREEMFSFGFDYIPSGIGLQPISWSGTNFTFQLNHQNSTLHTNWTMTGSMSADGRTVRSITLQRTDRWFSGSTTDTETIELRLKDLPEEPNYPFYPEGKLNYGGFSPDAKDYLESFSCRWNTHDGNGNPYSYDYVSTLWGSSDYIYVQFYQ